MRHARRKGAALVMVLVTLALLLVLAVSFTFLMTQQEGTSVASLAGDQTRIIARTGADHAYARLGWRNRLNEFERWYAAIPSEVTYDNDPFSDPFIESQVFLRSDFEGGPSIAPVFPGLVDSEGRPLFRTEDPRSLVLGLNVEDETGKPNLNFSQPELIANLIGSSTVVVNSQPVGQQHSEIILEDASFLAPYDTRDDGNPGGGYVVLDGQLFQYAYRRGNVLYSVTPNPLYQGVDGVNALFIWRTPDREIRSGEFATTPNALKVAYYRVLAANNDNIALFNSLGDVRRIAELPRFFARRSDIAAMSFGGWPEGLDPIAYQTLLEHSTVITPTQRFDGGWHYPLVVTSGGMIGEGESGLSTLQVNYDTRVAFQAGYYVPFDPRLPAANNPNQFPFCGYGEGNLVRLRRMDGSGQQILGIVKGGNRNSVSLIVRGDHIINVGEPWIVEVAERDEININTASETVLAAVFHGVGARGQNAVSGPISRTNAQQIARAIVQRVRGDPASPGLDADPAQAFTSLTDLDNFLRDLSTRTPAPITSEQVNVFTQMQRYPYARLQGITTARFRYDSLDVYRVDAFATRYMPTGGVLARDGFREWVQIGSDATRTFRWHTYEMLANEMRAPQGNILYLQNAGTENGRAMGLIELPYLHYEQDERYMRAWRAPPFAARTPMNVFQLAVDTNQRREKFYSNVAQVALPSGAAYEGGDLESGMFSFWYRRKWEDLDADHFLFDVAEQEFSNRMSLLWWGGRRTAHNLAQKPDALIFRIKDRGLDEAYLELRYELNQDTFRHDDWYHATLNWKGTELSHVSMLLDGDAIAVNGASTVRPEVMHTFREAQSGAWVSRTSVTMVDLPDPVIGPALLDLQIDSDDIDAFPPAGVIVVGSEAIEYNGNNGFALQNLRRGARGTFASFHPRGSKITVFGYTAPLRQVLQQAAPNQHWRPRFPDLPPTNGLLRSNLGSRSFYRVSRQGSNTAGFFRPQELGPDAGFAGGGSVADGGNPNLLPLADYAGLPERGVVMVVGQAWHGYFAAGSAGIPQAGVRYPMFEEDDNQATIPTPPVMYPVPSTVPRVQCEFVAYNGITGSGLNVVARYDANFNRKDPALWYHFLGTFPGVGQTNELISPSLPTTHPNYQQQVDRINFFSQGSVVMLVSLDVDDVSGYHDRSIVQIDDEWFYYNVVWDTNNAMDATGATATGRDDNLFPSLILAAPFQKPTTAQPLELGLYGFFANAARSNTANPTPIAPWRGACGTAVTGHIAAARVLPTFGTTVTTGQGDVITLVQGKNSDKVLRRIRQQRDLSNAGYAATWINLFADPNINWPLNQATYICAVDDHVSARYAPNTMNNANNPNFRFTGTNMLKFPSGELPVNLPTTWQFAGADPRTPEEALGGDHSADFDSFEFRMYNRGDFRLVSDILLQDPMEGGEIQVNTPLPPNLGVVKIDDELIAYRGTETRTGQFQDPVTGQIVTTTTYHLINITRGVLGSPVQVHAGGTPIMNMASLRVGRPQADLTARDNVLRFTLGEESFKPFGFVRVWDGSPTGADTEVLGYQKYAETQTQPDPNLPVVRVGTITAGQLLDTAHPQALFRGAYGTRAKAIPQNALVFDQPVRFPDWFPGFHLTDDGFGSFHSSDRQGMPGTDSPEISYFQASACFRNAVYTRFRWRVAFEPLADMARHSDSIGARLVIRFKQRGQPLPDWSSIPLNRPGSLYAFEFEPGSQRTEDLGATLYEQTEDFTRIRGSEGGIRAEGLEYRVYFYFKQGAFDRDDHKTTLQFRGADVNVNQLSRVLRHEERR